MNEWKPNEPEARPETTPASDFIVVGREMPHGELLADAIATKSRLDAERKAARHGR